MTQSQAYNALVFLYKCILQRPLENVSAARSSKEPRIPVVLTREEVIVRNDKGNKDRVTPFPASLEPLLKNHLERVNMVHEQDLAEGFGAVYLPFTLARKYPNAEKEWNWQYVFPSRKLSEDPRS